MAIRCLFVVIEFNVKKLILLTLNTLEEDYKTLVVATNASEAVVTSVQRLKEFIDVTDDVWLVTTFTACLTSVSYVFHILACYRKHMKRLWAGEKQFLPLSSCKLSHSVAAIARYSGWQIAYLIWGYLIVHILQFLVGMMLTYSLILPIKHGQWTEVAKSWGTWILTVAIVVGLMGLQIAIAMRFFLQPKILLADKEKPLALDNRKAFHNFNYFFFFYNVVLGLSACLFRLLSSVVVGAWLIARIDRTIMPKGYEGADMENTTFSHLQDRVTLPGNRACSAAPPCNEGFRTWIGMLLMDHYHTNPILVCFCHILEAQTRLQDEQRTTSYHGFNNGSGCQRKPEQDGYYGTRF